MLALLCTYNDALPQGAPTSPAISNIIMREFDDAVGTWCSKRKIAYTRYCDDMTFSGNFDAAEVLCLVSGELRKPGLFLNDKKTVFVRRGQRQSVTGIVVNEKQSIPSEYKKRIRQEMYYCKKFGIRQHLEFCGMDTDEKAYVSRLLGRVNYVLSVEKDNAEMKEYKNRLSVYRKEL